MRRQPKKIILRLAPHDTLRQIRLGDEHDAGISEDLDDVCIFGGGLEGSTDVAEGRVVALDVELVLYGHWDAVEGTDGCAMSGEVVVEFAGSLEGCVEEDLCVSVSAAPLQNHR